METFKYINREYTPSVDLTTLGKTFDTLEQGHQDAVKAASDLRTAVASLDMNEADDDFKQQLINEIETTIDNNTVYGNSYAALDDLIAKTGDIASDGRVIGRLRSQAAKKEYDAKVDAMAIPEGMKQMYKEENPYYYVEGETNERTGKTAPGELWKPKTNPVATVSPVDIQQYALQIAAEESGSYQTVTFLDKNGKPTPNAEESADGLIYQQTGTTYQKLSKEKIAEAYRVAINSIPGAEDSLRQDFKYADWQYKKLIKKNKQEGGDITPYVPGVTDRNGNKYSYDQWLDNKISEFSDKPAYNRVKTDINFGTALQNFRQHQNNGGSNYGTGNINNFDINEDSFGVTTIGYNEVEVEPFAGAQIAANAAEHQILNIFESVDERIFKDINSVPELLDRIETYIGDDGHKLFIPNDYLNPEQIILNAFDRYNVNNEIKIKLNNAITGYYAAKQQYYRMVEKSSDPDAIKFSRDISNNNFINDNKYSRSVIQGLNEYFEDRKYAEYLVGQDVMNGLLVKYNTDIQGMAKLGFNIVKAEDDTYNIKIYPNNRNLIPRFVVDLCTTMCETPDNIGGWAKTVFTSGVGKGYAFEKGGYYDGNGVMQWPSLDVAKLYHMGLKEAKNAEEKVGLTKGYVTLEAYDSDTFSGLWYRENYNNNDKQSKIKEATERVNRMFAIGATSVANIGEFDKNNVVKYDVSKKFELQTIIQKMYSNPTWAKQVSRSCVIPNGVTPGQDKGYKLTFVIPEDVANGTSYKANSLVNLFVSGLIEEGINYDPSYNPNVLANNAIHTAKTTNTNIDNIGYNTWLGNTQIINNNDGTYTSSIFGSNITLNEAEAINLIGQILLIRELKNRVYVSNLRDSNVVKQIDNSINQLSNDISSIVNIPSHNISLMITNYVFDK